MFDITPEPGDYRSSDLPKLFTDDEMQALVDSNLYGYDGLNHAHATPNYRYCKPITPCYRWDNDEQYWEMEDA